MTNSSEVRAYQEHGEWMPLLKVDPRFDDLRSDTLQSWSLGLPAFYEQGFGNPEYASSRPRTAVYWQDTWQLRRGLTLNYGLRYELDSKPEPLNTYHKNFGPRVSLAWDPIGDHRTVVRVGYGIFYSPIYFQIPDVVKTLGNINDTRQIANTLVSILGVPGSTNPYLNSPTIYQVMFAPGKILCGTPPAGQSSCITAADIAAPPINLQINNSGSLPPGPCCSWVRRVTGIRNHNKRRSESSARSERA